MVFGGLPKVSHFRVFAVVSLLEFRRQFNFEKHPTGAQLLSPVYLIFCSRLKLFWAGMFSLESLGVVKYCFSSLSLLLLLLLLPWPLLARDGDGFCRRDLGPAITRRTPNVNAPGIRFPVLSELPRSDERPSLCPESEADLFVELWKEENPVGDAVPTGSSFAAALGLPFEDSKDGENVINWIAWWWSRIPSGK